MSTQSTQSRFDIHDIVKQSCLDDDVIPRYWLERSTTTVYQPLLEEKFRQKQQELASYTPFKELATVSHAFGLVKEDTLIDDVFESRTYESQEFSEMPLGDVEKGVNLFLHADLLMEWAEQKGYMNPSLIVYKIIKGRCKVLQSYLNKNDRLHKPKRNYECHVLQQRTEVNSGLEERIKQSQIYVYEYGEDRGPVKHPRHCLPYAVISLQRKDPTVAESETESTSSHHNVWLQRVPSKGRRGSTTVAESETESTSRHHNVWLQRVTSKGRRGSTIASEKSPQAQMNSNPKSDTIEDNVPVNRTQDLLMGNTKEQTFFSSKTNTMLEDYCVDEENNNESTILCMEEELSDHKGVVYNADRQLPNAATKIARYDHSNFEKQRDCKLPEPANNTGLISDMDSNSSQRGCKLPEHANNTSLISDMDSNPSQLDTGYISDRGDSSVSDSSVYTLGQSTTVYNSDTSSCSSLTTSDEEEESNLSEIENSEVRFPVPNTQPIGNVTNQKLSPVKRRKYVNSPAPACVKRQRMEEATRQNLNLTLESDSDQDDNQILLTSPSRSKKSYPSSCSPSSTRPKNMPNTATSSTSPMVGKLPTRSSPEPACVKRRRVAEARRSALFSDSDSDEDNEEITSNREHPCGLGSNLLNEVYFSPKMADVNSLYKGSSGQGELHNVFDIEAETSKQESRSVSGKQQITPLQCSDLRTKLKKRTKVRGTSATVRNQHAHKYNSAYHSDPCHVKVSNEPAMPEDVTILELTAPEVDVEILNDTSKLSSKIKRFVQSSLGLKDLPPSRKNKGIGSIETTANQGEVKTSATFVSVKKVIREKKAKACRNTHTSSSPLKPAKTEELQTSKKERQGNYQKSIGSRESNTATLASISSTSLDVKTRTDPKIDVSKHSMLLHDRHVIGEPKENKPNTAKNSTANVNVNGICNDTQKLSSKSQDMSSKSKVKKGKKANGQKVCQPPGTSSQNSKTPVISPTSETLQHNESPRRSTQKSKTPIAGKTSGILNHKRASAKSAMENKPECLKVSTTHGPRISPNSNPQEYKKRLVVARTSATLKLAQSMPSKIANKGVVKSLNRIRRKRKHSVLPVVSQKTATATELTTESDRKAIQQKTSNSVSFTTQLKSPISKCKTLKTQSPKSKQKTKVVRAPVCVSKPCKESVRVPSSSVDATTRVIKSPRSKQVTQVRAPVCVSKPREETLPASSADSNSLTNISKSLTQLAMSIPSSNDNTLLMALKERVIDVALQLSEPAKELTGLCRKADNQYNVATSSNSSCYSNGLSEPIKEHRNAAKRPTQPSNPKHHAVREHKANCKPRATSPEANAFASISTERRQRPEVDLQSWQIWEELERQEREANRLQSLTVSPKPQKTGMSKSAEERQVDTRVSQMSDAKELPEHGLGAQRLQPPAPSPSSKRNALFKSVEDLADIKTPQISHPRPLIGPEHKATSSKDLSEDTTLLTKSKEPIDVKSNTIQPSKEVADVVSSSTDSKRVSHDAVACEKTRFSKEDRGENSSTTTTVSSSSYGIKDGLRKTPSTESFNRTRSVGRQHKRFKVKGHVLLANMSPNPGNMSRQIQVADCVESEGGTNVPSVRTHGRDNVDGGRDTEGYRVTSGRLPHGNKRILSNHSNSPRFNNERVDSRHSDSDHRPLLDFRGSYCLDDHRPSIDREMMGNRVDSRHSNSDRPRLDFRGSYRRDDHRPSIDRDMMGNRHRGYSRPPVHIKRIGGRHRERHRRSPSTDSERLGSWHHNNDHPPLDSARIDSKRRDDSRTCMDSDDIGCVQRSTRRRERGWSVLDSPRIETRSRGSGRPPQDSGRIKSTWRGHDGLHMDTGRIGHVQRGRVNDRRPIGSERIDSSHRPFGRPPRGRRRAGWRGNGRAAREDRIEYQGDDMSNEEEMNRIRETLARMDRHDYCEARRRRSFDDIYGNSNESDFERRMFERDRMSPEFRGSPWDIRSHADISLSPPPW